jgi:hypothetical protein
LHAWIQNITTASLQKRNLSSRHVLCLQIIRSAERGLELECDSLAHHDICQQKTLANKSPRNKNTAKPALMQWHRESVAINRSPLRSVIENMPPATGAAAAAIGGGGCEIGTAAAAAAAGWVCGGGVPPAAILNIDETVFCKGLLLSGTDGAGGGGSCDKTSTRYG